MKMHVTQINFWCFPLKPMYTICFNRNCILYNFLIYWLAIIYFFLFLFLISMVLRIHIHIVLGWSCGLVFEPDTFLPGCLFEWDKFGFDNHAWRLLPFNVDYNICIYVAKWYHRFLIIWTTMRVRAFLRLVDNCYGIERKCCDALNFSCFWFEIHNFGFYLSVTYYIVVLLMIGALF